MWQNIIILSPRWASALNYVHIPQALKLMLHEATLFVQVKQRHQKLRSKCNLSVTVIVTWQTTKQTNEFMHESRE